MNNMSGLLQQAQQMQRKMVEIEKKLSNMEVVGEVSNGLVKVVMTGKGVVKNIKIDESLKEDIEILEDLIVAAMHEAKKNADSLSEQEMKSVTGGMPMPPGLKF
ncbi:MAG: YbaB/EbfC family nucleoid-associated protein [Pelagibacterales bacterium]|nr:YbaB/EbfC family nucleoid-associated protein [Pelagibacterales bacterium]OUU63243.1 MAG: YbaB/EbfC family nucleoid-associated protein [Alphaproteobacteria bacterium TMED62]|tara:strand:- start:2873 stop:3184 length:312 start_codon:yes stop_codon:yes gene_type:complete